MMMNETKKKKTMVTDDSGDRRKLQALYSAMNGVRELRTLAANGGLRLSKNPTKQQVVDALVEAALRKRREEQEMREHDSMISMMEKLTPMTSGERQKAQEEEDKKARMAEADKDPLMFNGFWDSNQPKDSKHVREALALEYYNNDFYAQRPWWRNAFICERLFCAGRGAFLIQYPTYHELTKGEWLGTQARVKLSKLWFPMDQLRKLKQDLQLFNDTQWEALETYDIHQVCPVILTVACKLPNSKTGALERKIAVRMFLRKPRPKDDYGIHFALSRDIYSCTLCHATQTKPRTVPVMISCPNCFAYFYCSAEHRTQDRARHRSECHSRQKTMQARLDAFWSTYKAEKMAADFLVMYPDAKFREDAMSAILSYGVSPDTDVNFGEEDVESDSKQPQQQQQSAMTTTTAPAPAKKKKKKQQQTKKQKEATSQQSNMDITR